MFSSPESLSDADRVALERLKFKANWITSSRCDLAQPGSVLAGDILVWARLLGQLDSAHNKDKDRR
jgi:hypothetical protein